MIEKITRIDHHMKYCLQNLLHINLHILLIIFYQHKLKYPKIIKIQQVHQEIHTKQFLLFYLNCFLLAIHLNLMRLKKRD